MNCSNALVTMMIDYESMYQVSCGLFVAATSWQGKQNGCIINTVMQVSYQPLRCIAVIEKKNLTHEMVMQTKTMGISVLSQEITMEELGRFGFNSGRDLDKFEGVPHRLDEDGNPLLTQGVSAVMTLRVKETVDLGTHTMFICGVAMAEETAGQPPLTYAQYRERKNQNQKPKAGETKGGVYLCTVCKYEYDEEAEGVPFDELPDDWVCPLCGRPKSAFQKVR